MNLMKFFGFENDDEEYEDNEDYKEEPRRKPSRRDSSSKTSSGTAVSGGKLILFNGIASDEDKVKLREAFDNGAMILIDLHELNPREYDENGKDFINFMSGVAFARNGELRFIEPAQYLVTPGPKMFEVWPEGAAQE